jgi:AcrR family transcriptional regulator
MCARKYNCVVRQAAVDQNRARIIAATRELLMDRDAAFSIDAVAQRAGVARMTVYYQFESKRGLLAALFDDLAMRSLIEKLRASFAKADPAEALDALIEAFAHFWHSERTIIRRLRGAMATDVDFETEIRSRDERRREHLRNIIHRARITGRAADEAVDVLHVLSSFETFDSLAASGRTLANVTRMIQQLARAQVGSLAGDIAIGRRRKRV